MTGSRSDSRTASSSGLSDPGGTPDPVFVFTDVETTGLDEWTHDLLEVAVLVTSDTLETLSGRSWVVEPRTKGYRERLDPKVAAMHEQNGLFAAIDRGEGLSPRVIAGQALAFLEKFKLSYPPMCGASVHFDRRFLRRQLPELEVFFHYRNIDVSTLKELRRIWYPDVTSSLEEPEKSHRALRDVEQTAELLRYYRQLFFVHPSEPVRPS